MTMCIDPVRKAQLQQEAVSRYITSGVSIVYQGGVLTQVLQHSMVDSNVISFEIARKRQLPSPRTRSQICGAISSQHTGLSQAGVERLLRTVQWLYAITIGIASFPLDCGEWQINIFTKLLVSSAYILKSCVL